MLNRRILRIKVFKELFSYSENRSMSRKEVLSEFERSCEAVRDLYLFVLGSVPAVTAEAARQIEAARGKFNPTPEERNPNLKFVQNDLARLLEEDPDYRKLVEKKQLGWEPYDALVRSLYDALKEQPWFAAYMAAPERTLAADTELFARFFEELLQDNDALESILEEKCIYWVDDLDYALMCAIQSLRDIARKGRWDLPPLYRSDVLAAEGKEVDSDKAFAEKLLGGAFASYEDYEARITGATKGWDRDRICQADRVLIILGLAEVEHVPAVPARVSVNEFVELAKYFSTPRSAAFVNGLLDSLVPKLIEEKGLAKQL